MACEPQLELQVGRDRDEVGVAGALAVAVDGALHVGGPGSHGGDGVGGRAAGVVVAVRADPGAASRRGRRRRPPRPGAGACRRWCRRARRPRRRPRGPCGRRTGRSRGRGASRRRSARSRGRRGGPWPTRWPTVSRTISRFSSSVVRSARSTWPVCDFATRHTTDASESTSARTRGSCAATPPARRVAPKAARVAWRRSSSVRARSKNSVSFGLAPGQPPSMKSTPRSSSSPAMASLSDTERLSPSCWAPSRRVVS